MWPLITQSPSISSARVCRVVGSEPATSGSVIEKHERMSPSSSGSSHRCLLLVGAVLGEDLRVAGIGGGAVEGHRRDDRAAAHLLAEQAVLPVGQPGAVLVARHEHVPEALGAGPLADADDDLGVGDTRLDLVVERCHRLGLDRVDVLIHERAHPSEQLLEAVSIGEIHRRGSLLEGGGTRIGGLGGGRRQRQGLEAGGLELEGQEAGVGLRPGSWDRGRPSTSRHRISDPIPPAR